MHKVIAATDHLYTSIAMDIVREAVADVVFEQNINYTAAIGWLQATYRNAYGMYGQRADAYSRQIIGALGALHREHEANKAAAIREIETRSMADFS